MFTPKLGGWTWFLIFKGETSPTNQGYLLCHDFGTSFQSRNSSPQHIKGAPKQQSESNVRKQIKGIPKTPGFLLGDTPIHLLWLKEWLLSSLLKVTWNYSNSPLQNSHDLMCRHFPKECHQRRIDRCIPLDYMHRFAGRSKKHITPCVSWNVCHFCAVIFVAGLDLQDSLVLCDQLKSAVRLRAEFPFRRRMVGAVVEDRSRSSEGLFWRGFSYCYLGAN